MVVKGSLPEGAFSKIPSHIAIIMDGNRRWAKRNGLQSLAGHKKGADTVRRLMDYALGYGIEYVTFFAFSSENWSRNIEEVDYLMGLFRHYLKAELQTFMQNDICVKFIGERNALAKDIAELIDQVEEQTSNNKAITIIFAINYGSRIELTSAVKQIAQKVQQEQLSLDDIKEDTITQHLYLPNIPDPDLLIRTSGEVRVSNFLLWQLAYAEMVFLDVAWPDFKKENFLDALRIYENRQRRFGGD